MQRHSWLKTVFGDQEDALANESWKRVLLIVGCALIILGVLLIVRSGDSAYLRLTGGSFICAGCASLTVVGTNRLYTHTYNTAVLVGGIILTSLLLAAGFVFFLLGF